MKKQLLLISKNTEALEAYQYLLTGLHNWTVHLASSREEINNKIIKEQITLILSECEIDKIDGVELLTELSKNHPDTTRILLTHQPNTTKIITAITKNHITKCITQPIEPADFCELINQLDN